MSTSTKHPVSKRTDRFRTRLHILTFHPDGLQILLDGRPVRTPTKDVLLVPHDKHQLATGIALEWDSLTSNQQALKQHFIPLTSLTSRAIDIQQADAAGQPKTREDIVHMVMQYLHTDTLLCWASGNDKDAHLKNELGETLREVQMKMAQPIIKHLTSRIWPGLEIQPVLAEDSIIPGEQPEMTQQVIKGWASGLPAFELAALERAVLASKSFLVAARLVAEWSRELRTQRAGAQEEGSAFSIDEATEACSVEVRWQTAMWGEVEDTHDVEREDLRRQLGSAILLIDGRS